MFSLKLSLLHKKLYLFITRARLYSLIGAFFLKLSLLTMLAPPIFALDLTQVGTNLGLLEETDDRLKGAFGIWTSFDDYDLRYYYSSKAHGPALSEVWMLHGAKNYALSFLPSLKGFVGIALLEESTSLHYKIEKSSSESSFNIGINLGLKYRIFDLDQGFFGEAIWDSGLYPAGLSGLIFLAFGRKQIIAFSVGKNL